MQHRHKRNCVNLTARIVGTKFRRKYYNKERYTLCVRDFIKMLTTNK